jgi:translation initiation factor IF-3
LIIASKERDLFINEQIRAKQILVIGPKGEQLGVKSREDALVLADYSGFDLVLINGNSNPPVCKLMDYKKFVYEKKKKQKENDKKQRETNLEMKEFRLSVTIDIHDFDTKVRNASKYLEKGNKVKASIKFKGRQLAHTELGEEVLLRFADKLSNVSDVEQKPKFEFKTMMIILSPKKK